MTNAQGLPIELRGTPVPVKVWAHEHDVEYAALNQLRNIASLPWVHGVRAMPDVHLGKGATVGSVIAMKNAVSPSAVGVDIGCGMAAVKTSLVADDLPDNLHGLRLAFEAAIPVGFNAHDGVAGPAKNKHGLGVGFDRLFSRFGDLRVDVSDREGKAASQCGTLGGGNHFLEVCTDTDGAVWLMLHSGSRNIGKELAERHIGRAKTLDWNSDLPDRDLAVFLRRDESGTVLPEWEDYLHDLYWAQDYALLNRHVMMSLAQGVMERQFEGISFGETVQCHHNYVAEETLSDGTELVVTRKGAISAKSGQLGLIPGSMGTGSYVVKGLGSEESYFSASHGAGRKMSRSAAKRTFTTDDLAAQTAGVECRKDAGVVDEIPGAYKDLGQVMANQEDLVEIVTKLDTLLCVKG